jgi:branched-chain amino acid transport system substrate-binding protein
MRKNWFISMVLLFALSASPAWAASKEIRIGLIGPMTGVLASFGKMMTEGATLALEEVDYKVAGVPIKVIFEDNRLNPEQSVLRAIKLAEQDKVDIITGLVSGSTGLAVHDWGTKTGMPLVFAYSAPEDITMRQATNNSVRPTWTGAQPMDPFGYWLAKEKGFKKIYMIGQDYSFPHNQIGGLKRGFFRGGGQEVRTVWHPMGTDDFSSIIARIPVSDFDAVLYAGAGSDGVAFMKQWVDFGMLDKIPLLGFSNTFEMTDLPAYPAAIADKGMMSAIQNADNLNTPEAVKFREAYQKRFGALPSTVSEHAYSSMKLILNAIEALKGDVSDRAKLIGELRKAEVRDAPRGPVVLDEFANAVNTIYFREVKTNPAGGMWNVAVVKVENVSQFGPYDPKVYMSQPPDTRTYPADTREQMPKEMLEDINPYVFIPMK